MTHGTDPLQGHDLSSLRVLGSVGEPINPEAWLWYSEHVGKNRAAVCDTYWMTETGGHIITPLAGVTPMKPGFASLPFFGQRPVLLSIDGRLVADCADRFLQTHGLPALPPLTIAAASHSEELSMDDDQDRSVQSGALCLAAPWPGMARTVYGDHARFVQTYFSTFPGFFFTGDGASIDADHFIRIQGLPNHSECFVHSLPLSGRMDDVVNVSGHRISSAEVEAALGSHPDVAESAVVGVPHEIKGQALFAFVVCRGGVRVTPQLSSQLRQAVRTHIGAFASPDYILICRALPKTRSGKIIRRILRKIGSNESESLGDLTTLADEGIVDELKISVAAMFRAAAGPPRF